MKTNPMNPKNPAGPVSAALKLPTRGHNRADLQKVNNPKTNQGSNELFKKGGSTMATKGVNPFAKFEKSGKDVEKKGMKEGSKADMAMDKKQMMGMKKGGMPMKMKDGKKVPIFMSKGGFTKEANGVAKRGLTKGTQVTMKKGGKC